MAELVSKQSKFETVRDLIQKMVPVMKAALPAHLTGERFGRTALTTIQRNPLLLECSSASLAGAILQCAQLGLEPVGPGGVWLVPFKVFDKRLGQKVPTVTVIADYRGLLDLVRRSGLVGGFQLHAVYAEDKFEYGFGLRPRLVHVPSQKPVRVDKDGKPVQPVAFYFVAHLKDGTAQFDVMLTPEVEQHRDRFARAAGEGPWVSDFAAMGMKTVVRRGCKLLPSSVEYRRAAELDEKAEIGETENFEELLPAEFRDGQPSRFQQLGEQLKEGETKSGNSGVSSVEANTTTTVVPPESDVPAAQADSSPAVPRGLHDARHPSAGTDSSTGKEQVNGGGDGTNRPESQGATGAGRRRAPAKGPEPPAAHAGGVPQGGPAGAAGRPQDTVSGLIDAITLEEEARELSQAARKYLWARHIGTTVLEADAPVEKLRALLAAVRMLRGGGEGK